LEFDNSRSLDELEKGYLFFHNSFVLVFLSVSFLAVLLLLYVHVDLCVALEGVPNSGTHGM